MLASIRLYGLGTGQSMQQAYCVGSVAVRAQGLAEPWAGVLGCVALGPRFVIWLLVVCKMPQVPPWTVPRVALAGPSSVEGGCV